MPADTVCAQTAPAGIQNVMRCVCVCVNCVSAEASREDSPLRTDLYSNEWIQEQTLLHFRPAARLYSLLQCVMW